MRGYLRRIQARGIDLPENAVIVAPASIEGGIAALRRAWEDGLRPTGVLAMSDAMAIGVLRAARELGLRVPATCRSSASTTSTSASTRTRR